MTPSDIIRAWKDPHYRAGLPATARAQLPTHPAGAIELPEPTLHAAWPHQGFRVKSGLRGGAPTNACTQMDRRAAVPMAIISGRTTCRSCERLRSTTALPVPSGGAAVADRVVA